MDRNEVIRILQERAGNLLAKAKMLDVSDPRISPPDPEKGWCDHYWGEAFGQYDDELTDVHLWLEHNAQPSCKDAFQRALTELDEEDERCTLPGQLDYRKHAKEAFRFRKPFIAALKRTAKEFTAIAEHLDSQQNDIPKYTACQEAKRKSAKPKAAPKRGRKPLPKEVKQEDARVLREWENFAKQQKEVDLTKPRYEDFAKLMGNGWTERQVKT